MKRRTLLLPALLAIVVGLSGCTALDKGIVRVEPKNVHDGEWQTITLSFQNYEPWTVTVSSIDCRAVVNGTPMHMETIHSEELLTDTVPPFQEVLLFTNTDKATVGTYALIVMFHTSEGDFPASVMWLVLP